MADSPDVTLVLQRVRGGDRAARDALLPLVYDELRQLAGGMMRSERAGHTLQTTALVHEAYVRLIGQDTDWANRAHFFGVAALAMRRVLVDHARAKMAAKRGGGSPARLESDPAAEVTSFDIDVLSLNELLDRLAALDERKARVVELRFFGGMTNEQIAESLGIARSTVSEDWAFARAWLAARLKDAS
jgi:RNA polymerase sigma factor (TIGR02999 family)